MTTVSELYQARVSAGQLEADAAQRSVLPAMDRVVRDLSDMSGSQPAKAGWFSRLVGGTPDAAPVGPKGLYLWGGVGRGKSMLMDMIMDAAPIAQKRRVHFHEFMQEIHAGLDVARKSGERDAVRPIAAQISAQTRLLCFDEMQISDIADAMIVGRLFELLLAEGVIIVTTSNRVPEDLYKNGLNRQLFLPFIALIRDRMEVVELLSATDHRQDRAEGGQVWFAPADATATAQLDRLWQAETGGAATVPLTLSINGRKVELPRYVGRVARVNFWDMCGRPLGPADYLAVAEAVDVLFIDSIPRLSQANFNEAKRFVTLVDALYEAKVRLIASGADEPERLYAEGEGAFEFERTASRLREMRDAQWGRP